MRKRDPNEKKRKPEPLGNVVSGFLKQSKLEARLGERALQGLGDLGVGAGDDAVDAMEGEPALASERHGVTGREAERSGRRVALKAAHAKHRSIPER